VTTVPVVPAVPAVPAVPDAPVGEGVLALAAREWAALGALGLGLLACGSGAGHLALHPAIGGALTALGLAALGWSLLTLRGPVRAPRAAVGALLVAGPAVLLTAPLTGTQPSAAEGAALVLALGSAIALALGERAASAPDPGTGDRRRRRPFRRRRALGALGQVAVLGSGALLVALVTVPGLAATEAGAHAVPHGSHGLPAEEHHPGH
jgi:hypothetical protein